jgi:hypothetical protein
VVGLESGIGWHAYELGRYAMPAERWEAFLDALRSGLFRKHITSAYRRGPRSSSFVPGRMYRPEKEGRRCEVADRALCGRFTAARMALRLSGTEMAAAIFVRTAARVYNIEASKTSPTGGEMSHVESLLAARLVELESLTVKLRCAADIAAARTMLRISQDEMGRFLFERAARPGAAISIYEGGGAEPADDKLTRLSVALQKAATKQGRVIRGLISSLSIVA